MDFFRSSPPPASATVLSHPVFQALTHNPLNLALSGILLYLLLPLFIPTSISRLTPTVTEASRITSSEAYNYLPAQHPQSAQWKKYTPKSLAIFDGSSKEGGATILLSINRKVFDVTTGGRFYGPGGSYGNFAGRDASRGMAKQSFDLEMLTPLDKPIDSLADLSHGEKTSMREWEGHFSAKYPVVGELVEEGEL